MICVDFISILQKIQCLGIRTTNVFSNQNNGSCEEERREEKNEIETKNIETAIAA